MIDENKLEQIKRFVKAAEDAINSIKQLIGEESISEQAEELTDFSSKAKEMGKISGEGRIIEGIFDGLNMVGPDGKQYNVPANYASKSKLVEGDLLKLTIADDGSFVFKQIGPVERKRLIGILTQEEQTGEYRVLANGKSYKVLLASITYFRGESGDEVVILVPKGKQSIWSAVENIVKGSGVVTKEKNIIDIENKEETKEKGSTAKKEPTQTELEDLEI